MNKSLKHTDLKKIFNNQHSPIAIILSCGTNGLGLIRSLGRENIPVLGLDYSDKPGFHSSFCRGMICPNPLENEEEFIDFIYSIGEKLPGDGVLLPAADYYTFAIAKHIDSLKKYFYCPFSNYSVIEKIGQKKLFYKHLQLFGFDHPDTYIIEDISELPDVAAKISYPCIIKPSFSSGFTRHFGQKLFLVSSREELVQKFISATSNGYEPVIQEWIPGADDQIISVMGYIDGKGIPRGIFTVRKLRQYPNDMGNGSLVISERIPEAIDITLAYLKKIEYHGLFGAEFKWDHRDESFKFIEINARLNLQNALATRCGVNLPYIAYKDAIGEHLDDDWTQIEGIKWIYFLPDLLASYHLIKKRKMSISKWLSSYLGKKQHAVFSSEDPIPYIFYLKDEMEMLVRQQILNKIRFLQEPTLN